jgi:Na+/melibiose symporter-like transporter
MGAMGLPGFFAAFFVQQMNRTLPYLVVLGIFQRLPWLALTLAVPLLWGHPKILAFFMPAAFLLSWLTIGLVKPAWASLIQRGLPPGAQGRFRGSIQFWGSALALFAALLLTVLFHGEKPKGPWSWFLVLALGTTGVGVSFLFFLRNIETPIHHESGPHPRFKEHLRWGWHTLTRNRLFQKMLLTQVLTLSSAAIQGRLLIDAVKRHGAGPEHAGVFSLLLTAGTGLSALFIGPLSDRRGPHRTYALGAVAAAAAVTTAFFAPNLLFVGAALLLFSVHQSAIMVSSDNLVFRHIARPRVPAFLGLLSLFSSPLILTWSLLFQKMATRPEIPPGLFEGAVVLANLIAALLVLRISPKAS